MSLRYSTALSFIFIYFLLAPLLYGQNTNILPEEPFINKIEISHFSIFQTTNPISTLDEISLQPFKPYEGNENPLQTKQYYWLKFEVHHQQSTSEDYFLFLGDWAYTKVLIDDHRGWVNQLLTGRFVKMSERTYQKSEQYIPIRLEANSKLTFYVCLKEEMAFYLQPGFQVAFYSEEYVNQEMQQKLFYQGIFLGIILVMALYNLFIYISVKDSSSLYYVCSIAGVGLYFMFYYGFTLELFWAEYPVWNAFSFVVIVPLTRITWVLFTKKYLKLKEVLPQWNNGLNYLMVIYIVPVISGLVSMFSPLDLTLLTVNSIGVLGVVVLSMMLLMGYFSWEKGYRPAYYFLIANLFFSIGSILFIFRETGWLPDNFFTRYSPQLGVVVQVVLFSLGLANRINTTQQELAQKALDNERLEREKEAEKTLRIEVQKEELENLVAQRTADLKSKTQELEVIVEKLKASEADLKELNHLKDNFFSIISHDLRSPLATLTSFLNILTNFSSDFSEKEMKALALKTQQSVKNLSFLLDNLLQWALNQMNLTIYQPQEILFREVLEENQSLLSVYADEKNIEIQVEAEQNLRIYMDRNILAFVLRNLMMNAIKFTQRGGKVIIMAHHKGNRAELIVRDNGPGIQGDDLERIFDYRHHFIRKGASQEKGIGLGLMLCKEFIEKSGGDIRPESTPNVGTSFYCQFPGFTLETA